MSIGAIIAFLVLVVVVVGLLVSLPEWALLACIGGLALAVLLGRTAIPWGP